MGPSPCPYCGSERMVWDSVSGHRICSDCGTILGELMEEDLVSPKPYYTSQHYGMVTRIPRRWRIHRHFRADLGSRRASDEVIAARSRRAVEALSNPMISAMLDYVNKEPELAARTFRSRVALAVYVARRVEGYPHSAALRKASRESGMSAISLGRTIKRYRGLLWRIVRRVREDLERSRGSLGSSIAGEEDTRTYIRGDTRED